MYRLNFYSFDKRPLTSPWFMMYSQKKLINKGIKYFSNFGAYCSFSEMFNSDVSAVVSLCSIRSSINEVVDSETDVNKSRLFGSLINKKATNCNNGITSIKSNVVSGEKPISLNAA